MSRTHSHHRAFVTAASMLLAIGVAAWPSVAHADKPASAPGADKPASAPGADKPRGEAAPVKAKAAADPAGERAARQSAQHEAQRSQLRGALTGPMTEAVKQELRRHAQRVARIERIKTLAIEQKDKDATERADKLLTKENARHEKWLSHAGSAPAATPPTAAAAVPPKVEVKGGAR